MNQSSVEPSQDFGRRALRKPSECHPVNMGEILPIERGRSRDDSLSR
jgi:hypothetical protein